jgi:hypothetical protein
MPRIRRGVCIHKKGRGAIMARNEFDRSPVSLAEKALWDERLGVFRVKVQGNRQVGSLVILRNSDMPISHLDSTLPRKQTKLGQFLRERLEMAVNASITTGTREIGHGLSLLSPDATPEA